jgi:LacI family transcriptional regulator
VIATGAPLLPVSSWETAFHARCQEVLALRTVTLDDVARRAGVSRATASRALNGSNRTVGAALRESVERAAAELGYEPNLPAQALARSAGNVVGLVVHDLADPYFAVIADAVTRAADRRGLVVMVGATGRDPEREIAYVAALRAQRVRAVLLVGSRTTGTSRRLRDEVDRYRGTGGRVACVGQDLLGVPTVAPANHEGARALAHALAGLGHRRFAILGGPPELITARERTSGFRDGLAEQGLPEPVVVAGAFDRDGGHAAAASLDLSAVSCLFAVNDVMAVGAVAALRERGIDVPGTLAVAGFDDIPSLRDLVPALTTVRLPLADMGERALELALDETAVSVQVPAEVILRDSTRRD